MLFSSRLQLKERGQGSRPEPARPLADQTLRQEQQRAGVQNAEYQHAVITVTAEVLRYGYQQYGAYHWAPQCADAADHKNRHQLSGHVEIEKSGVSIIQIVRIEAACDGGIHLSLIH